MNNGPRSQRFPAWRFAIVALTGSVFLLAACGGGSGETSAEAVATLEDGTSDLGDADETATAADTGNGAGETLEADEAALAFSACMRDEGLDFPDIGVDAEGNPQLRDAFGEAGLDPRSEEFQAAREVCGELLQGAGFGGGRQQAGDNPEVQDAFVEYSECLRDEGLDVGDLQLGGNGGPGNANGAGAGNANGAADGDGPQRGQGQGRGGFANRTERLANQLGLDAEDPQVIAATEACGPILDNALGQFGQGGAGRPGAGQQDGGN